MKRISKILMVVALILIVVFVALGNLAGRLIIQINQDMYRYLKENSKTIPQPSDYGLKSEQLSYVSNDGLHLNAVLVKTSHVNPKGTILLIHGIRAGKEHYLPASKLLADNGYHSVLVDLRAHGQSEGKYCTFGFYEKQDITVLIDSLNKRNDVGANIGIWGNSLGAAVSLQAMAMDKRIKFGVIESTFSDFRTVVYDYSERTIGVNIPLINDYAIWWAEWMGEFDAEKVKPSEAVKHISQPVIMIHGDVDSNIDIKYGKLNYKNLLSKDKEFIEVHNANHGNVWQVGGESYFSKVITFVNRVSLN